MSNVNDYFPELAHHFEGKPDLDFWEDKRSYDIKLEPAPGEIETQIDAFAYWTVHAGDGTYEEKKSMFGYVVSIASIEIGDRSFFLEYYLHQGYTQEDYWRYSDGIANAVAKATSAAAR